jgi:glycerophosphoryl diester phosphodiesterase
VDRTTDGEGYIAALDYAELRKLDAGVKFSPDFKNTRLPLFEEVLEQFGKSAVINLHIKSAGQIPVDSPEMRSRGRLLIKMYHNNTPCFPPLSEGVEKVLPEIENRLVTPYPKRVFESILALLGRYNCMEQVYITGEKDVLITAREMAPQVPRCCLEGHMNYSIVENALAFECRRVQFCKTLLTQDMINKARAHGLHCNLFWSDDPMEARAYLDLGIDTLLTNAFDVLAGSRQLTDSRAL